MNEVPKVRAAFLEQARWCQQLGSPFTARLCEALAAGLRDDTEIGREILEWRGDPRARADALPLRVAGALHALARDGRDAGLAALYPPASLPDAAALAGACRQAFERHPALFREFMAVAPQTNEVGRSAVLMAGLLLFAQAHDMPLHLFEIGASAGLNLIPDRYRYRFGSTSCGDPASALELAPTWTGSSPPVQFRLRIASRQGSDVAPIDLAQARERKRLVSYVWPDQADRLARLEAALGIALAQPTRIEASEAAAWVEQRLPARDIREGGRVLLHSILWRYLPEDSRRRIEARVAACGKAATASRPFGWLRLELDETGADASLLLDHWPGAERLRVAASHPHGRWVNYLL